MHCGGVVCSVPQQPSGQCLTVVEAIEHGDEVMMAPPKHTPYAKLVCGAKMGAVCGATATCGAGMVERRQLYICCQAGGTDAACGARCWIDHQHRGRRQLATGSCVF